MMIYVSIILGVLALMALAILVKLTSILQENVDGIREKLAYMHLLMQAVDHKVSKASGVKDGHDEYIDELVKEQMSREEQKDK